MGIEIVVGSLEEMCDLMCNNVIPKGERGMTNVMIYDDDADKLNEAAATIGETVATIIEWLIEEHLDEIVEEMQ